MDFFSSRQTLQVEEVLNLSTVCVYWFVMITPSWAAITNASVSALNRPSNSQANVPCQSMSSNMLVCLDVHLMDGLAHQCVNKLAHLTCFDLISAFLHQRD